MDGVNVNSLQDDLFSIQTISQDENIAKLYKSIDYVLWHECWHMYVDKIARRIGVLMFQTPKPIINGFIVGGAPRNLIHDGIAEFFRYYTMISDYSETEMPKATEEDFKNWRELKNMYTVPFNVVEPILKPDVEAGVIKLINNPPSEAEMNNLLAYRERSLSLK